MAGAPGVCYGRLDLPLAEPAAAAALAVRLAGLDATVWTSPAQRCRSVAAALGPHHVDPRLQELDFGAWEGMAWDGLPRALLDNWAADPLGFAPPGGESGAALVARVSAFAAGLRGAAHVVITHGGPLRVLRPLLQGLAPDLLAPPPAVGSVTMLHLPAMTAPGLLPRQAPGAPGPA